jgi:regulator of cell morphogenesis and NO signaling
MSLKETTDAIVATHHSFLRRELPRLSELLEALFTVSAVDAPSLLEAQKLYTKVRTKIEAHLRDEEGVLFPTAAALEEGVPPPPSSIDLRERLQEMEIEHDNCGKALGTLEQMLGRLSNSTHKQETLAALQELRADLDVHVEKENSLVHPRLFELLRSHEASKSAVT